jgi:hypothetical protein
VSRPSAPQSPTTTPTAAQLKWLRRADALGVIVCYDNNGLARANWRRTMERMVAAGFVTPYVHGGYELTASGQAAVASPKQNP